MRRISLEDIRIMISVQLSVIPAATMRAFTGKRPAQRETAREAIVDQIVGKTLHNAIVIIPDPVPAGDYGQRPGKFGVTEPDPLDGS